MPRKKKVEVLMKQIVVFVHDQEVVLNPDELKYDAFDVPCDLCGSHGQSSFEFFCPVCKDTHEIILKSW